MYYVILFPTTTEDVSMLMKNALKGEDNGKNKKDAVED